MLRITVIPGARSKTVKVEGRIAGPTVMELRQQCEAALVGGDHANVVLDLSAVSFLDHEGIELIRHLLHRRVVVTNYSPFVGELLKEVVPCS